jgi:hypothetical protein
MVLATVLIAVWLGIRVANTPAKQESLEKRALWLFSGFGFFSAILAVEVLVIVLAVFLPLVRVIEGLT